MVKRFINYLKEVIIEIRKIDWPSKQTVKEQTKGVIALSLIVAGIISIYDYTLAEVLKFIVTLK